MKHKHWFVNYSRSMCALVNVVYVSCRWGGKNIFKTCHRAFLEYLFASFIMIPIWTLTFEYVLLVCMYVLLIWHPLNRNARITTTTQCSSKDTFTFNRIDKYALSKQLCFYSNYWKTLKGTNSPLDIPPRNPWFLCYIFSLIDNI